MASGEVMPPPHAMATEVTRHVLDANDARASGVDLRGVVVVSDQLWHPVCAQPFHGQ